MKLIYTISFFLFFINGINSQSPTLIYDCRKDSNDYISNLKVINGEVFFNSGKVRNPKGVAFCGNGGPREFKESHVYKLIENNNASKIFHHYLENDFARIENQIQDSSKIFAGSDFMEFSDSSGIFLFSARKNEYWIKINDTFHLEKLPADKSVSSYYPKWYDDLLIVRGSDSISGGRLWYFNKKDLKLKKLLKDTFLYKAHNLNFHNDYLIFHGYSKRLDKDHALFFTDKNGTVTKITEYDPATVFTQFQTIFKGKLIYRIVHRGVVDSYKNKDFTNTELWEYDFKSGSKKRIFNFVKYGLTYSAREFGGKLYFFYGLKNYRLFELEEGDITAKNDLSKTLDSIKYIGHRFYELENRLYFVGESKDKVSRLYGLGLDGTIQLMNKELKNIKHLQIIDGKLFFTATSEADNCREIYLIEPGNGKIQKTSALCLTDNRKNHFKIKNLNANIYFEIKNEKQQSIDLYYFDDDLNNLKLVFKDVKNTAYHFGLELKVLKEQIFLISRENLNNRYHQIWKIE